ASPATAVAASGSSAAGVPTMRYSANAITGTTSSTATNRRGDSRRSGSATSAATSSEASTSTTYSSSAPLTIPGPPRPPAAGGCAPARCAPPPARRPAAARPAPATAPRSCRGSAGGTGRILRNARRGSRGSRRRCDPLASGRTLRAAGRARSGRWNRPATGSGTSRSAVPRPGRGSGAPRPRPGIPAEWRRAPPAPAPSRPAPAAAPPAASAAARLRGRSRRHPDRVQRRQQAALDRGLVDRPDVLPAHDALGVDQEGFRRAVDAPVDRLAAVVIHQHQPVGIAELLQPAHRIAVLVLPVIADHADALGLGDAGDHRMLDPAARAPAAPDVEQVGLAAQLARIEQAPRLVQDRQRELRRRLADQGRRQHVAVGAAGDQHAVQQQSDQAEKRDRDRRGHEVAWIGHQSAPPPAGCAFGSRRASPGARRKRRSVAVTNPPSAIRNAAAQIQRRNGLTCSRTDQAPSPSGSPRATNTSANRPAWMLASVITWPPLA